MDTICINDEDNCMNIHFAIMAGCMYCMKKFVAEGKINDKFMGNSVLLMMLNKMNEVWIGDSDFVKEQIEKAKLKNIECLNFLLDNGADIYEKINYCGDIFTVFHIATSPRFGYFNKNFYNIFLDRSLCGIWF